MVQINLTVNNSSGLHARPAALFVKTASSFKSKVTVTGNNKSADGKNIMAILALGAKKGTPISLAADGVDEAQCIKALKELVESNFGEK